MSRRVSDGDAKAHAAWIAKARAELPPAPPAAALEVARANLAVQMAHDRLDELEEYYLDELKCDEADVRAQALREMEDPIDLASYVREQLEDSDEWRIEAEALLDSVLDKFNEVVK